jgi:hypothetical protein
MTPVPLTRSCATCRYFGPLYPDKPERGCCNPSCLWEGLPRGAWEGMLCPDWRELRAVKVEGGLRQ